MKKLLALFIFCFSVAMAAQVSPQIQGAGAPANPCYNGGQQYVDTTNHVIYGCSVPGQNWVLLGQGNTAPTNIRSLAADPTTCSTADTNGNNNIYYNTVSATYKFCSATNTWSAFGAGGSSAFDSLTAGINTTAGNSTTATSGMQVSGTATLSPASTGQLAASQDWYQNGPGVISPVAPTLASNATGGTVTTTAVIYVKVTYVGLSVIEPSAEVRVTATGCTGGNQCSITVTMPTTCTAGNLPAGVTGCTVWDSNSTGTEKQQAASAACVNITTATCVIGTLAAGSTLTTPQTGITPAGAQAVTCPNKIIPTNWFQAGDGNFYNLAGIDVSALNLPAPAGTFTWCHRFFVNDTSGPPVIANALVSIHHQAQNLTNTGTTTDDRALGIEMIDTTTANPNFEQALTQYNERIVTNTNFTCAPISGGAPIGESCNAAGRFITNDSRTANVAGATSFEGIAGVASSSGTTAQASGTGQGYVGVKGGAFQATNSQNGNSNTWIGGYFGTNGASGNTGTATGIAVLAWAPTVRFNTQSIGFESQNFGSSINDWDFIGIGNGTTSGKNMFQAQVWLPSIVADNSTIGVLGSINATGGLATTQFSSISSGFTVVPFGTSGATADSYKATCVDVNGYETTASSVVNVATANADLTAAHGNTATVVTLNGTNNLGCSSFNIYRTAASSTCNGGACTNGKIGNAVPGFISSSENFSSGGTFSDTGQAGDGNTAVAQANTTGGMTLAGLERDAGTCRLAADTVLTVNTVTSFCTFNLPASALVWAVRCEGIWAISAGTGTNTFALGVNASQTPAATTNIAATIDTATASLTGTQAAVPLSASGATSVLTSGTITPAATLEQFQLTGTISANAAAGTFAVTATAAGTTATAAVKAGTQCRIF